MSSKSKPTASNKASKALTAKRKKATKRNAGGRPTKYKAQYAKQARKACSMGATNKDLAEFFDVAVSTIDKWIAEKPEFSGAIKKAKAITDERVVQSLFQRATGYTHPEEKIFCNNGEIVTHKTTKHYPPDATSCIFWLKNRQPDKWRDKQEHVHEAGDTLAKMFADRAKAKGRT